MAGHAWVWRDTKRQMSVGSRQPTENTRSTARCQTPGDDRRREQYGHLTRRCILASALPAAVLSDPLEPCWILGGYGPGLIPVCQSSNGNGQPSLSLPAGCRLLWPTRTEIITQDRSCHKIDSTRPKKTLRHEGLTSNNIISLQVRSGQVELCIV